ncbi:MAG TPA: YezD family protein [Sphingopyxis sp.]|nr:YezD family protein [Sphingopyxis sp.]
MNPVREDGSAKRDPGERAIQTVLEALQTLRFGAIQLTIHEGRLVQVDVTERHRYPN